MTQVKRYAIYFELLSTKSLEEITSKVIAINTTKEPILNLKVTDFKNLPKEKS